MADKIRNVNPSKQQPLPHRQQTAVRIASSAARSPHQSQPEGSTTCSDSSEAEISNRSNISSRISTSKFSKNEELPRKCMVVRRSAPKKGVTKTEIRLVIYNETQKKEGLRKMEFPALMDASEMLADRLRDLETKNNKEKYEKDKDIRRQLEGVARSEPTSDYEKKAIAKLKKVAPSLCNESDTTTATPIRPQNASPNGSIRVSPSIKQNRKRKERPPAPVKSTTVINDKDLDQWIDSLYKNDKSETETKSKSMSVTEVSETTNSTVTSTTPERKKKKRKHEIRKLHGNPKHESEPRMGKVRTSPVKKNKSEKPPKKQPPVPIADSDDSSAPRPLRSKPINREPTQSGLSDDSEVSSKPLRKPPPHAIRERKKTKPIKEVDQSNDEEPKIEASEPRRPKKIVDQTKDEEPKEPKEPKRNTVVPLCDRRDCCMQQPCVKKDRKEEKDAESDQPTVTENEKNPSGKKGNKKKTRTKVVLNDDTSTTKNSTIEDSLHVLKGIYKKIDTCNSLRLKNNPDKEKVKAQLEKIINAVEGKLANGTKLNADDLDRMKRIVAKTAELRGTVSLATTVTITETVSVEDEDTE